MVIWLTDLVSNGMMLRPIDLLSPYWGRDKIATICVTAFRNTLSWIKVYELWLIFPESPINNIPALVQIMAWWLPGKKPLSEPMMVS